MSLGIFGIPDVQHVGFGIFTGAAAILLGAAAGTIFKHFTRGDGVAANAKTYDLANEREPELPAKLTRQQQTLLGDQHKRKMQTIKLAMVSGISVVLLISCLVLMFTSSVPDNVKWAQTTIALILGFWLKAITEI